MIMLGARRVARPSPSPPVAACRVYYCNWSAVESEVKAAKLAISTMFGSSKHIARFHGKEQGRAAEMQVGRRPAGATDRWGRR